MFRMNDVLWKIVFVGQNDKMLYRSDGSKTVAVTDISTHIVYISDAIRGKFLQKVLRHEIVHCAMASYNVELSIEQEELIADLIATYGEEIISVADDLFMRLREIA